MVGSFAVGAMMFGATFAGKMIQIGRLKTLYIASVVGIVGTAMTLFPNKYLLLGGRLMYGLATGFIAVAMPRYMDEVLPPSLIGLYGGLYCFSFAIATIMAYLLALGLPSDKKADGTPNT
jgi:SP family myo-inositol transporter-like MFS transporter 13